VKEAAVKEAAMKTLGQLLSCTLAFLLLASLASAQSPTSATVRSALAQGQLDQLLAPVALYPDPVLSQVLNAATYPSDLAEAARWSRENRSVPGEAALSAAMSKSWDASVKSLTAFPRLLATLEERADWIADLGQAFLAEEARVLDTIQQLRQKAYAAGELKSRADLRVERQGPDLVIESASPVLPRGLVYGGFDWRERHVHIVSIRFEPRVSVAVAPHDEGLAANRTVRAEAQDPEVAHVPRAALVAVSAKPAPLVDLAPKALQERSSRELARMAKSAPALRAPTPTVASERVRSLIGLGRPEKHDVPVELAPPPRSAEPSAKPRDLPRARVSEPERNLISLMPGALEGPEPAGNQPEEAGSVAMGAPETHFESNSDPSGPSAQAAMSTIPATRQRVFRPFVSDADRRTLDRLLSPQRLGR